MKTAVIQLCPGADVDRNVARALSMVEQAVEGGARFVALPEYFSGYLAAGDWPEVARRGEATLEKMRQLAGDRRVYLLAGTVLLPSEVAGKSQNVSVLFGPDGAEVGRYRKIHLFDVELSHKRYCESDWLAPGKALAIADVDGWKVGFSICFDLRFPDHFQGLRRMGAEVILAPSAFSVETGSHHWEPFIKSRAIETQCYLLAPALCGDNVAGNGCFGHAAAIDPWGRTMGMVEDGEGIVYAQLERDALSEARRKIPIDFTGG